MHILRFRARYRMRVYHINIVYKTRVELTPRTLATAEAFGLGIDEDKNFVICNADVDVNAGDVTYITGVSGSGKSSILNEFEKQFASECININAVNVDTTKPLVDTVGATLEEALRLLSLVGLNDAFLFLRKFPELSAGQQYRYKIAKMIESKKRVWIMDEFTSTLDRDTARIVAWNVQKFARSLGVTLLCATCMTDLGDDLMPNVRIDKRYNDEIKVSYTQDAKAPNCSLVKDMSVELGDKDDWQALMQFHYRSHKVMIPLKYVRLVRNVYSVNNADITEPQKELVGICIFVVPPLTIYGRKLYFGRCFNRNAAEMKELNANFSQISRVVIHPEYRSMGLGAMLIRESLKQAPTQYTETMAVMAKYNPFFERAGMLRVCERQMDKYTTEVIKALNVYGFELTFMSSKLYVRGKLDALTPDKLTEVKRVMCKVVRGPTYNTYMKGRGLFRSDPQFNEKFMSQDLDFIAQMIVRVALMATSKVYLVFDKAWLEKPELKAQAQQRLNAQQAQAQQDALNAQQRTTRARADRPAHADKQQRQSAGAQGVNAALCPKCGRPVRELPDKDGCTWCVCAKCQKSWKKEVK